MRTDIIRLKNDVVEEKGSPRKKKKSRQNSADGEKEEKKEPNANFSLYTQIKKKGIERFGVKSLNT